MATKKKRSRHKDAKEEKVTKVKAPKLSKKAKELEKHVETVCGEIGLTFGYPVQSSSPKNCIHSGSYLLDLLLSGGYRKGRLHTHIGRAGAGKSTMIQEAIWAAQQQKLLIYHFDVEKSAARRYMVHQRIKVDDRYVLPDGRRGYYYFRPKNGDVCYRAVIRLLDALPEDRDPDTPPGVVVLIDGYKAMKPEDVDDEKDPIANEARMHNRYQPMVRDCVERAGATLVASNQIRVKGIGGFMPREDEAAGNALLHYADARVWFNRQKQGAQQKNWGKCPDRVSPVTITIRKCRMADSEDLKGDLRLVIGRGFDRLHDRLAFLTRIGAVGKEDNKWVMDGKKYAYAKARQFMKEKDWRRWCNQLRRSATTYEKFFDDDDELKKEEW